LSNKYYDRNCLKLFVALMPPPPTSHHRLIFPGGIDSVEEVAEAVQVEVAISGNNNYVCKSIPIAQAQFTT